MPLAGEDTQLSGKAGRPRSRPDFAQLFEAMPGQYMVLDRDLVYVEANPAYCASTERAREDIIGRYVFEAFPPTGEGGRLIEESIRRVLATGVAETVPLAAYPIPMPGGGFQMKYWSCAHLPLFDEQGEVAFVAQNAVDVTELQNLKTLAFGPDPGAPARGESELFRRALEITAANESLASEMRGLRDLFMQAPGFMAVLTGPDLVYAQANNAYLQLIGHRPIVGLSLAEALPEVIEQGFDQLLRSVMREKAPHIGQGVRVMLQRRPGAPLEERFVDYIFQPIAGADGESVGVFVEGSDVTARVLAERRRDALYELEARLRQTEDVEELAYRSAELLGTTLGAARAGYGDMDHDRGTITVDRAWSLPGRADVAGVHDFANFGTYIDELRSGQAVMVHDVETDERTRLQAASFRNFGIRAFLDAPVVEDGIVVAEVFVHAETVRAWTNDDLLLAGEFATRTRAAIARRKAETALSESEIRYRALFESIDQGFCIVEFIDGPDGPLSDYLHLEANQAFERHSGVSGVVGRRGRELLLPEEADGWVALFREVLTEGESVRFEKEYVASRRYLEVACFRVESADRQVAILFQDVTAKKLAEQQLRELNETLERRVEERAAALNAAQEQLRQSQKMEAMGSLTGGVAHDFNNLLTPIVGTLDLLQRLGVGDARQQRLIAGAAQSAEKASTLVQRLLAFARRQPLRAIAVDLPSLVQGMADLISSTIGPQIKVVVDAAQGLPHAVADPNQVEMALLNLAVNARDAMPGGGELTIAVRSKTVGPGHHSKLSPGHYLLICVTDTGCGMDEETARRAIEPFFSTKGIGKGTGLGLSMVHGLVSQLGGTLTLESTLGVGTTVELWLPQSAAPAAAAGAAEQASTLTSGTGTALLVDDEDLVRLATADMLGELGYRVIEAGSAEEALRLIDGGLTPDLLVTDHLMPGMTGANLARAVSTRLPKTKVLVVSGYADTEGIAADLPRLTKPFRTAELASSLSAME